MYLRPLSRRELLATLAGLGVFVIEQPGSAGVVELARSLHIDFVLLVAGGPEDAEVARQLARAAPGGVVAVVPEGFDHDPWEQAGARAVIEDGDLDRGLPLTIARAAAEARRARDTASGGGTFVFGALQFEEPPAVLRNGPRTVTLSRSERDVLTRLLGAQGRPVARTELMLHAGAEGPAHPGLLKAVVLRLRRKAADLGGNPEALATVRGFGYALREW